MKAIKHILKKFDVFGVPFLFRYRNEDKFPTSLGGITFILFAILVVAFGIYYFIPFFNRKNFNVVYYSMNLQYTEHIKLKETKTAIAFGLESTIGEDGTKAEDLLNLDIKYIIKDKKGNEKKNITLSTHPCNYSDFYNNFNDSIDRLNINKYNCLDKTDDIIEGIYTDEIFSYYELSVYSKEDTSNNFDKINDYLLLNDCKFQIYYSDITIDINNYENPIQSFLNSLFIQINPSLFLKKNIYFMNQYFQNDNYLFFNFAEDSPVIRTIFSREEQYSLYKGLNRYTTKPSDYKNYAKIFVRADTKKIEIKRKYQKVMEFFADSSSLLVALFDILCFIFDYINGFYAEHSLSKQLFFFKEVKYNHLDIYKRNKEIKELIDVTENVTQSLKVNHELIVAPFTKEMKYYSEKECEFIKTLENKELKTYGRKNLIIEKEILSTQRKFNNEAESSKKKEIKNYEDNRIIMNNIQINTEKNELFSGKKLLKPIKLQVNLIDNIYNFPKESNKPISQPKTEQIKFSYNLFEIIISSFFCCFMPKKLRLKKNITEKANIILNDKLDIVSFVRNMIFLEILSQTLVNNSNNKKGIIKFLSRPVVSVNKKSESDDLHAKYCEKDFDNFYYEIEELVQKSKKSETDKKLISLSNQQLKEII